MFPYSLCQNMLAQFYGAKTADSTYQLTGYRIQQDIKNERLETTRLVKGNIEGYKEPIDVTFYTPNRIKRTDQYVARRDKFYKWRELKSE